MRDGILRAIRERPTKEASFENVVERSRVSGRPGCSYETSYGAQTSSKCVVSSDTRAICNLLTSLKTFHAQRNDEMCMTLGLSRGHLNEQIVLECVENRVLVVSTFKLRRLVKYFWAVHNFVRGLRGALLGM